MTTPVTDASVGSSDVETVQVADRWVNRLVETGAVVSVNLNRATAIEAGVALAKAWSVHHHVVYTSAAPRRPHSPTT